MVKIKKWFFNFIALSIGVLITLIFVEIGVRLFAVHRVYEFPQGLFIPDDLLDFRMASNFKGRHLSANYEWDIIIETNSEGFWDYEHGPKKGPRILGVGDSFTFPFGVGVEQGYLGIVEAALDVEVVKTGVSGYDPVQYRDFIKNRGLQYDPDLVIVGFYIGNDIHSNYKPKPTIMAQNGVLVQAQQAPSSDSNFVTYAFKTMPTFLRKHYHTYGFVMDRIKSSPVFRKYVNVMAEDMRKLSVPELVFMELGNSSEYVAETWLETERILTDIQNTLKAQDIGFLVVLIPTDYQVDSEKWKRVVKQYEIDENQYNLALPNKKLMDICRSQGIQVLDLLPMSLEETKKGKSLYFTYNRHWSIEGNRMAGIAIADFIRRNHLMKVSNVE